MYAKVILKKRLRLKLRKELYNERFGTEAYENTEKRSREMIKSKFRQFEHVFDFETFEDIVKRNDPIFLREDLLAEVEEEKDDRRSQIFKFLEAHDIVINKRGDNRGLDRAT